MATMVPGHHGSGELAPARSAVKYWYHGKNCEVAPRLKPPLLLAPHARRYPAVLEMSSMEEV